MTTAPVAECNRSGFTWRGSRFTTYSTRPALRRLVDVTAQARTSDENQPVLATRLRPRDFPPAGWHGGTRHKRFDARSTLPMKSKSFRITTRARGCASIISSRFFNTTGTVVSFCTRLDIRLWMSPWGVYLFKQDPRHGSFDNLSNLATDKTIEQVACAR